MVRSYFSKSIQEFHQRPNESILFELIQASEGSNLLESQKLAWEVEISLLKNQLLKKYEAQLQEALAEQSAGIAQDETKNKQNILISELKAQVDHQDKQKKLLRQKYRDLKNEMQELQVTQNRPSTHEQGKTEGHVIFYELKLFVK